MRLRVLLCLTDVLAHYAHRVYSEDVEPQLASKRGYGPDLGRRIAPGKQRGWPPALDESSPGAVIVGAPKLPWCVSCDALQKPDLPLRGADVAQRRAALEALSEPAKGASPFAGLTSLGHSSDAPLSIQLPGTAPR